MSIRTKDEVDRDRASNAASAKARNDRDEEDRKRSRAVKSKASGTNPTRVVQSDGRIHVYDGPDARAHADDPGVFPDRVEIPRAPTEEEKA